MKQFQEALTFDDVLLKPAASSVLPNQTDTRTRLTRTVVAAACSTALCSSSLRAMASGVARSAGKDPHSPSTRTSGAAPLL